MTTGVLNFAAAFAAIAMLAVSSPPAAPNVLAFDTGGHPFMALPSLDGSSVFVSVQRDRSSDGILVVRRSGNEYPSQRFVAIDGSATGMALTPDGKVLLIAAGDRYAAVSVASLQEGATPRFAYLQDRSVDGAIEVETSADGAFAFFTNENNDSLGVVRIGSNADGSPTLTSAERVSLDHAPVGIARSPDGTTLFVTSELASGKPKTCANARPQGSVSVIDIAAAESTPDKAVIANAAAGCSPVRVAIAPDGKLAWVTERGDDRLAAFDTAALRSDPDHALRSSFRVGTSPVGLALARDGALAFVANSNRFDRNARNSTVDVIDLEKSTTSATFATSYPTGAFPRELRESPLHDVVYLTNYNGGTVEVLPIP
jgi:DNA-binding beta-propeller fold protein YncE